MDTYLLFMSGAIVLLLVLSAFFSGAETALTAVSRGRMHQLEKEGSRRAASVGVLVANRERMIGALLLGSTFVNILASSLATATLTDAFGNRGVVYATIAMTIFVLVFSEILPKTLAITHTDRFALAVARPVRAVVLLLAPIVGSVQAAVWGLLRLFGIESDSEPLLAAHEEIRGTVELHHKEGTVEREHRDMISGVLDLRELTVGDVMVHRKNLVAVDAGAPRQQIVQEVIATNHTRIPLFRDQPENIIGVLHTKDFVRALVGRRGAIDMIDVVSLATPPWFVPEQTTLEEQLAAFRKQRSHFALVVDEYGVLQGLITLEDILDEIIGDIPDQHEVKEPPGIRRQPDGTLNIDGDVPVREINRALDWNLPEEEATTLAGLIINEARTIPDVGQRFAFHGFEFEIIRRQRNQITAIRVTPRTGEARSADGDALNALATSRPE
jgi:Mg2+/Co2+ transporter CorB